MKIETLEKICEHLKIPILNFFTDSDTSPSPFTQKNIQVANGDKNQQIIHEDCERELKHLQEIVSLQNELIKSLKKQLGGD